MKCHHLLLRPTVYEFISSTEHKSWCFEECCGHGNIWPHWLSLYGHFNFEKSTNCIFRWQEMVDGSMGQQSYCIQWQSPKNMHFIVHSAVWVTNIPWRQVSISACWKEQTVVYFLWRTGCESLQLLISQNHFLYVDPVFYVCGSLSPETAFSCDFYRVGTKPRVFLCSWVQYIYSQSNGLADSKTMQ